MQLISYFLAATLYTGLFLIIYKLLLARQSGLALSRSFLWLGIVAALIMPVLRLPIKAPPVVALNTVLPELVLVSGSGAPTRSTDVWILVIYWVIAAGFALHITYQHASFIRRLRGADIVTAHGVKCFIISEDMPGSYMRTLLLSKETLNDECVVQHELAHIRLHHYIDLIALQLLYSCCWPNFLLRIVGRELRMVHEYQADRIAAGAEQKRYSERLLRAMFCLPPTSVAHYFFLHPIKNRIMMLQKKQDNGNSLRSGAAAMMLTGLFIFGGLMLQTGCQKADTKGKIVYDRVDQPAQFDGDISTYLVSMLKYPEAARQAGKAGRTVLKFTVEQNGSLQNIEIVKRSGVAELDNEALRVVKAMPKWKPGLLNGAPVATTLSLPISFRLD